MNIFQIIEMRTLTKFRQIFIYIFCTAGKKLQLYKNKQFLVSHAGTEGKGTYTRSTGANKSGV